MTTAVDPATPHGLGLRDALAWRRRHSAFPTQANAATVCLALVMVVPVHVALFLATDHAWFLLAVPLNPLALYLYLWGWGHLDVLRVAAAMPPAFAGSFLPFYLM